MALAAGEVPSGGVVRDPTGRRVIAVDPSSQLSLNGAAQSALLPTGGLAETFSRVGPTQNVTSVLVSGRLWLVAIGLNQGVKVSNISFFAGTTALATGSNQWFALYSSSLALLATTADDTSNAWTNGTAKTLAVAKDVSGNTITSYTTLSPGLFYLGVCVVATTVPTLAGIADLSTLQALAPAVSGNSTTALTGPASAPNPAAALGTATSAIPYAWVS